ncbi:MAG: hypothetical protein WDW38_009457 [Sanguina aurantia]
MGDARLKEILLSTFGLSSFRGKQLDAINATLQAQDSIVVLPTGAGKSLTFQFPPFVREFAFTVVICPLIALLKEQVEKCQELGLDAMAWNGDTPDAARTRIISDLSSDEPSIKLLYTTPESLKHPKLREAIQEAYQHGTLASFAIDEAHCVSEWGHDFRPAYLELSSLKVDFPLTPIAALTASCTKRVERSIMEVLKLKQPVLVQASFNRPNIQYQVRLKELLGTGSVDDAVQDLVEFLTLHAGESGIIYARLRATCDWLTKHLSDLDLDVACYHAGKDSMARARVQREWSQGAISVVVATIAFGMGIDRAAVRWVIHWDAPSSLEGFYQESGRAGRDAQPSLSIVYASNEDLKSAQSMERGSRSGSVAHVAALCMQPGCRRKKLLAYFGEKREACNRSTEEACDFCRDPAAVHRLLKQLDGIQEGASMAAGVHAHMQRQGAPGGSRPALQPHALSATQTAGDGTNHSGSEDGAPQHPGALGVGARLEKARSRAVGAGAAWGSALARQCGQASPAAAPAPGCASLAGDGVEHVACTASLDATVGVSTAHCVPDVGFKKLHRPTLLPKRGTSLTAATTAHVDTLLDHEPALPGDGHSPPSPPACDRSAGDEARQGKQLPGAHAAPRFVGLRPVMKRPRSNSIPGTAASSLHPTHTPVPAPCTAAPPTLPETSSDLDPATACRTQSALAECTSTPSGQCVQHSDGSPTALAGTVVADESLCFSQPMLGSAQPGLEIQGSVGETAVEGATAHVAVLGQSAIGAAAPARTGMLGRKSGFKVPFRVRDV